MSAFLQSKAHIDAVVRLAIDGPRGRAGRWESLSYYVPTLDNGRGGMRRWAWSNASELGALLWGENLRSVAHRYPNDGPGDRPGPIGLSDDEVNTCTVGEKRWSLTIPQALMAVDGLVYQSCEHPEWGDSEAKLALEALFRQVAHALPGYDDAGTWSIDEDSPLAVEEGVSLSELMARRRRSA